MKGRIDMDKIARGLGAERRGKVAAPGSYFGAIQLLADIEVRFRVPPGGGRPTDATWTELASRPVRAANAEAAGGDRGEGAGARGRERRANAARRASSREESRGAE